MAALNYAKEYQQALEQEFPYVLYFGALFATPNNGRYRWVNSNVIEIPTITTTGRVDGDRDTIGQKKRNYNNSWTPLQVTNHRTWSTLVHPRDIQETNQVASIANITRVFNEEQKFPEMNCYLISKLYADYTAKSKTADQTVLTTDNVLDVFDKMMTAMDNKRVPRAGRILYVTPDVRTLITNAKAIVKTIDVSKRSEALKRAITSIDEVEIPDSVPSDMMKTAYDFTEGWEVRQIRSTCAWFIRWQLSHLQTMNSHSWIHRLPDLRVSGNTSRNPSRTYSCFRTKLMRSHSTSQNIHKMDVTGGANRLLFP